MNISRSANQPNWLIIVALLLALFATACGNSDMALTEAGDSTARRSSASGFSGDSAPAARLPEASAPDSDGSADEPSAPAPVDAAAVDTAGAADTAAAVEAAEAMEDSADDAAALDRARELMAEDTAADGTAEWLMTDSDEAGDDASADLLVEPAPEPEPAPTSTVPRPRAGLLTAGDVDDNLNYDFFVNWISQVQQRQSSMVPRANLADRVRIDVRAGGVAGLGNVPVVVSDGETEVTLHTSTAGVAWLYPHHVGLSSDAELTVEVRDYDGGVLATTTLDSDTLGGDGSLQIDVDSTNQLPNKLDLALVLDATGSMTDELNYLTRELEATIDSVRNDYSNVDVSVALIVYRDVGDDYVTRVFDFADVDEIRSVLEQQSANGGGDFPEAMHSALSDSLEELSWRSGNTARMLVLNADAPPHQQHLDTTIEIGKGLAGKGVRIYPLAASGVDETAEFTMRVLAATSGGRHMFLTDDSGIGNSHSEPKVECYQVTALNDLLRRVIASELAGERIEASGASVIRTVGQVDRGQCV